VPAIPALLIMSVDRPEVRFHTLDHPGDRVGLRDIPGNLDGTSAINAVWLRNVRIVIGISAQRLIGSRTYPLVSNKIKP
jgi:hypothetical protein